MDNTMRTPEYESILEELKNRVEGLKMKCLIAQEKVEKEVRAISSIDRDIGQTERELSEHKSKTIEVQKLWESKEIEIEELKWMEEKASVILESNRKKNELQSKTMNIIRQNHSNITTCAFKTVRQETAREIIKSEINNLLYREKELENEIRRWKKTKTENEKKLADARVELIAAKARGITIQRLQKKLNDSENLRSEAAKKLNDLKTTRIENTHNSQLSMILNMIK